MNLDAPKARVIIGPQALYRWRSNGHLRRCRCASAPHVPTAYAPLRVSQRLATHRQEEKCRKSPKGASDAFLNRLKRSMTRRERLTSRWCSATKEDVWTS